MYPGGNISWDFMEKHVPAVAPVRGRSWDGSGSPESGGRRWDTEPRPPLQTLSLLRAAEPGEGFTLGKERSWV